MCKKYPSDWSNGFRAAGWKKYLEYSIGSPLCIILMARAEGERSAGYIFSTIDSSRFWRGFALRHPVAALMVMVFRAERNSKKTKR